MKKPTFLFARFSMVGLTSLLLTFGCASHPAYESKSVADVLTVRQNGGLRETNAEQAINESEVPSSLRTPAASGSGPDSVEAASMARRYSVEYAVRAITLTHKRDLAEMCRDCEYDKVSNTTKCDFDNGQLSRCDERDPDCQRARRDHQDRCENILWSAQNAKDHHYSHCSEFMVGDDGNLGEAGYAVLDEIVSDVKEKGEDSVWLQPNANFLTDPDNKNKQLCPAFNSFDHIEKMQFYLFLMENIAYRELACSEKKLAFNHASKNSPAVCMFQLESDPAKRKTIRPEGCQGSLSYIDSLKGCGKCATQIMRRQLSARSTREQAKADGRMFLPQTPFGTGIEGGPQSTIHSYWQSLNPDSVLFFNAWKTRHPGRLTPHRALINDIKYFPGCRRSIKEKMKVD